MRLNEFINQSQSLASEFYITCGIVNGEIVSLDDIENMGYDEFAYRTQLCMPKTLYKYFPNTFCKDNGKLVNYSMQALQNNTVYLQTPGKFDDVYDSDINVDYLAFEKQRLIQYCNKCNIDIDENLHTEKIGERLLHHIAQSYQEHKDFDNIFCRKPKTELERLSNILFQGRIKLGMTKNADLGKVVSSVLQEEYQEFIKELQSTFRVSCFTTTPFSQLMWSGYANEHKGFCVEYKIDIDNIEYKDVFYNLFPLIYCKTRPSITSKLINLKEEKITTQSLWDIYFNGALRKSVDWAFQNEWRLLLPLAENKNEADYNVRFFPISRVFLGNRMPSDERKKVIDFCNSRNIPYVGVTRNPNIFEMQPCGVKCEECNRYKLNLHKVK